MKNTIWQVKETGMMLSNLIWDTIGAVLRVLSIFVLIGRLITKPFEIAIAILRDLEGLRKEADKKRQEKKEKESKKGSSSFCVFLFRVIYMLCNGGDITCHNITEQSLRSTRSRRAGLMIFALTSI